MRVFRAIKLWAWRVWMWQFFRKHGIKMGEESCWAAVKTIHPLSKEEHDMMDKRDE